MADGQTAIATPFPIDFETVRKDEFIPRERCERIIAILWATGRIWVRNPLNERDDEPSCATRGNASPGTAQQRPDTGTVIVATIPPDESDPGPPPVYGMDAYRFALLRLAGMLQDGIAERMPGSYVTCRSGGLQVLSGVSASDRHAADADAYLRGIRRSVVRLAAVDTSEMTAEEYQEHQRRAMRTGRMAAAAARAKREPRPPELEAK